MKKITILIILPCFLLLNKVTLFAQTSKLDSLIHNLSKEKNEDKRIDLVNIFLGNTAEVDPVLDLQNNQKLLRVAQTNKDKVIEAIAMSNIGYDFRAFGNTEVSLDYLLKANELAAETGNEKLLANTRINLAHIYKDLSEYTKAIPLYFSVASFGAALKDSLLQIWAFNSLGEVYLRNARLDSALMFSQRAYELSLQTGNVNILSTILNHLGAIHGRMGNALLAKSYFAMAIHEGNKTNSLRFANGAYTALAKYFFENNQTDSAIINARKAIDVVKNTAFSNKSIIPAKLLLDFYENINSDSAIKYFKIYKAANDSLFSAKTIQQTQLMTFQSELKQQELLSAKQSAEQERKQNIQYALIAIGIIVLISLYLLLSRSFITNTNLIKFFGVIALLIVFEFLNLLLHPFLERVTHHSPILMLLALVAIAALLVPLHHKLEHWATTKLVEKNKEIRLAAAKKTIEQLELDQNKN